MTFTIWNVTLLKKKPILSYQHSKKVFWNFLVVKFASFYELKVAKNLLLWMEAKNWPFFQFFSSSWKIDWSTFFESPDEKRFIFEESYKMVNLLLKRLYFNCYWKSVSDVSGCRQKVTSGIFMAPRRLRKYGFEKKNEILDFLHQLHIKIANCNWIFLCKNSQKWPEWLFQIGCKHFTQVWLYF